MKWRFESTRRLILGKKSMLAALTVALLLMATMAIGCSGSNTGIIPSPTTPATSTGPATLFDENTVVSLYQKTIPAVVQIDTTTSSQTEILGPFGFRVPQMRGQGSGFFIDNQGHILTNNHVVNNADQVKVTLHDGTELNAKVLGTDVNNDLAVLQVDSGKVSGIAPLAPGDSDQIKPGQMAIALGSPYGLEGSITVGVISGVGRSIHGQSQREIPNLIQTDAAINPGNSGGPLLDSSGEVIGINTAIQPSANSIGYAIPINLAKSMLPALIKGEKIKTPWLGIEGQAITPELAHKLDLPVDKGVYVIGVVPDSPAQKSGLKESGTNSQGEPTSGGDIITKVDGVDVAKVEDLISYFNGKRPGDEVTLSIVREGKQMTVKVTLGEWPENASPYGTPSPQN